MELNITDSGRKITCMIAGNLIKDGELYYCPKEEKYFIFQNMVQGLNPETILPEDKGYDYSWCCHIVANTWFDSMVVDFKFKDETTDTGRDKNELIKFERKLEKAINKVHKMRSLNITDWYLVGSFKYKRIRYSFLGRGAELAVRRTDKLDNPSNSYANSWYNLAVADDKYYITKAEIDKSK